MDASTGYQEKAKAQCAQRSHSAPLRDNGQVVVAFLKSQYPVDLVPDLISCGGDTSIRAGCRIHAAMDLKCESAEHRIARRGSQVSAATARTLWPDCVRAGRKGTPILYICLGWVVLTIR